MEAKPSGHSTPNVYQMDGSLFDQRAINTPSMAREYHSTEPPVSHVFVDGWSRKHTADFIVEEPALAQQMPYPAEETYVEPKPKNKKENPTNSGAASKLQKLAPFIGLLAVVAFVVYRQR